jgi:hypothetical protein
MALLILVGEQGFEFTTLKKHSDKGGGAPKKHSQGPDDEARLAYSPLLGKAVI